MAHGPAICACCGAKEEVKEHHLYLPDHGCPDDLTIWLCRACDQRAHATRLRRVNHGAAGVAASQAAAAAFTAEVKPAVQECLTAGVTTSRAIARTLNERGIRTRRGGTWSHVQVADLLRRLKAAGEAVR